MADARSAKGEPGLAEFSELYRQQGGKASSYPDDVNPLACNLFILAVVGGPGLAFGAVEVRVRLAR